MEVTLSLGGLIALVLFAYLLGTLVGSVLPGKEMQ